MSTTRERFFRVDATDGAAGQALVLRGTDQLLGPDAVIETAALRGVDALLARANGKREAVRIAQVHVGWTGSQRAIAITLAASVASEHVVGGTVYLSGDAFARAVTRSAVVTPQSTVVTIAAAEAAAHGLPAIGLRFDHGHLSAGRFPQPGCYVRCSGPPGGTLLFEIHATAAVEGDAAAVRWAMRALFVQPRAQPVEDLGAGTVMVAGAARAAFALTTGADWDRVAWVGTVVSTPAGSLLVLAALSARPPFTPTLAQVLDHPDLAGRFASLMIDGGTARPTAAGPDERHARPSALAAAKQGAAIGLADEASGPTDATRWGPVSVKIDGWQAAMAPASLRRALGSLLGLAAGDALGTTHEFQALAAPAFPMLATGPLTDIVGGGPFHLAAGEVTDDTQMAAGLADLFVKASYLSGGQLAVRYLAWRGAAFDVGVQIGQALDRVAGGAAPERTGRMLWEERQRLPAGNGSLMRTAVLGVLLAGLPEARRQATFMDAALTHFDPRCMIAGAAFNASIAHALTGRPSPASMVRAAEDEVRAAAAALRARHADLQAEIAAAEVALLADLTAARDDDPQLYAEDLHLHRTAGFVRVAFRLAYWELMHAPDYAAAVIDAANRGGDADTNAAIVGALWGALAGVDGIPAAWVARVLAAPGLRVDDWDFHPRAFLRALARGFGADRDPRVLAELAPYVAQAFPAYAPAAPPLPVGAPVPPGVALATPALPLRPAPAFALLLQLLARARDAAPTRTWLAPELVFVESDGTALRVSGVLDPRALWPADADVAARLAATPRALLCAAPEVLTQTAPYFVSAVFSACAVYVYLLRRHGPYAAAGPLVVAPDLELPALLPPGVATAIRAGLSPDPRARPPASVLYELLRAVGT